MASLVYTFESTENGGNGTVHDTVLQPDNTQYHIKYVHGALFAHIQIHFTLHCPALSSGQHSCVVYQ